MPTLNIIGKKVKQTIKLCGRAIQNIKSKRKKTILNYHNKKFILFN